MSKHIRWVLLAGVGILLVGALLVGLLRWWTGPDLTGVWKATDMYGHEHYFAFRPDGTFSMWDRDRQDNGSFQQRGPFGGRYTHLGHGKFEATTGWNGYRATLEFLPPDGLEHDSGFGLRAGLTYRRVDDRPAVPEREPEAPARVP